MKIRCVSDLHVDHHMDGGNAFFREIAEGDFDVLVVAGDLCGFASLHRALRSLLHAMLPRPVVYVLGNHEAYGAAWGDAVELAAKVQREMPNLHFLEKSWTEIQGQRFVGTTLWFPHQGPPAPWSDFAMVQSLTSVIGQEAQASARFLRSNVQPGDVVVTHFLPHPGSIAPRYAGSPTNRFFLHDLSPLVEEGGAAVWFHGHTHSSCAYKAGSTAVLCNPFGYARGLPGEPNPAFGADAADIVL